MIKNHQHLVVDQEIVKLNIVNWIILFIFLFDDNIIKRKKE